MVSYGGVASKRRLVSYVQYGSSICIEFGAFVPSNTTNTTTNTKYKETALGWPSINIDFRGTCRHTVQKHHHQARPFARSHILPSGVVRISQSGGKLSPERFLPSVEGPPNDDDGVSAPGCTVVIVRRRAEVGGMSTTGAGA